MIKNKKFDDFFEIYIKTQTEVEQYAVLKVFLLSCSLQELIAWNDYLDTKSQFNEIVARGLSDDDHTFFKEQFAKFDALETQLKMQKAAA